MSEQTTTSQEAVETQETPVQEQETTQPDLEANQLQEPEGDAIPEKFVGKSPLEIARAYQELERTLGRLGSEKGHAEKKAEEASRRLAELESQYQQAQPPQHQQQAYVHPDPLEVLDKHWDENPREAIQKAFKTAGERQAMERFAEQQAYQARMTASHYEKLKTENPDFAELEPEMVKISNQYRDFIAPHKAQSPETLDLLYSLAKARNIDKIVDSRVAQAKKTSSSVREEKLKAFSESSRSEGNSNRDFASMSKEEMRKALGVSDKY